MNEAADNLNGVVVSKLEPHGGGALRGYIAMLAVREQYRGRGIATKLVRMAIDAMIGRGADEVSLNIFGPSALSLHSRLWLRLYLEANGTRVIRLLLKPRSRTRLR